MSKTPLKVIGAIVLAAGAGAATYFTLDLLQVKPVETSQTQTSESTSLAQKDTATEELDASATDASQDSTATTQISEETNQQNLITKNILSSIASGLNNYQANNRGTMPITDQATEKFVTDYLSQVTLTNPKTSTPYQLTLNAAATENIISYQPGYTCSIGTDSSAPVQGTTRQFALSVILPSGTLFCAGS